MAIKIRLVQCTIELQLVGSDWIISITGIMDPIPALCSVTTPEHMK